MVLEREYPGVQSLEADPDIFGLEKTTRQCVSCGNEELIDGTVPENIGIVMTSMVLVVRCRRLDEMQPHKLMIEHTANERSRTYKTFSFMYHTQFYRFCTYDREAG